MSELPSPTDVPDGFRIQPSPGPDPARWVPPTGPGATSGATPTGEDRAGGPVPDGRASDPQARDGRASDPLAGDVRAPDGPVPDAPVPDGEALPLPLAETAALVGEYRWIEHGLYRLLGRWVTDMPLATVQVHLDSQSMRHAWHAELWAERLPVRDGADPDALTVPSAPSAVLLSALSGTDGGGPPGPGRSAEEDDPFDHPGALPRLAGLYRVALPRLVTSYERHLRAVAPVTDGPVARALRLVLNDEIEDWRAGERLVQRLVTRPHDVVAVHEFLQHLESAVVGAGAASGLVALPASVPGD